MALPYTPHTWVDEPGDGSGDIVTAAKMNHIEQGIDDLDDAVTIINAIIVTRRVFAFFVG